MRQFGHSLKTSARWIGFMLLVVFCTPGISLGDDTASLPVRESEIPKVLFLLERNESMQENWFGDSTHPTKWDTVVDAVIAAVNSAPTEMEFAVVGTSNAANHYKQISSFDHDNVHLVNALDDSRSSADTNFPDLADRYLASSYLYVIEEYLTISDMNPVNTEWARAPFIEPCSTIDVIVISDGRGDMTDNDASNYIFNGDVYLTSEPEYETDRTLLDDVAIWAGNHPDMNNSVSGTQTVRTHTIFVDADTHVADYTAEMMQSAADVGSGLYTEASSIDDIGVGISNSMTDLLRSLTGVTVSSTSSSGHRLFRGWTEIWGYTDDTRGVPLYRGHFEAFKVITDPLDPNWGSLSPNTPMWDAGELLASRLAYAGEVNSEEYGPPSNASSDAGQYSRTLWTNPETLDSFQPQSMIPFDSSEVDTLGPLLLDYCNYGMYPSCSALPENGLRYDYNADQIVDNVDAQLLIDFLRGVPEAEYGQSNGNFQEKGPWKMGGMFLSRPAFADAAPPIVTDDPAFYAFLDKMAWSDSNNLIRRDSVIYTTSNSGWLHAFKVPFLDSDYDGWEDTNIDAKGGWELWGYVPRHVVDKDSEFHDDMHRVKNLKLDGELYINDGSVNLTYVWMDGTPNLLGGCGSAADDGAKDPSGCEYHRVLIVSMGMGSRYHYAVDVTDPWAPRFLWEWTGEVPNYGWRKGMTVGTPVLGEVLDSVSNNYVPVIFWSGGTSDVDGMPDIGRRVGARWYMVDLLEPDNAAFSQDGYAIPAGASPYINNIGRYNMDDPSSGVFGTPAAVDYDEDGTIDALYIGSRHGYVFKVLVDNGQLDSATMESTDSACAFAAPPVIPAVSNLHNTDSHAVFFRPSVAMDASANIRVMWGTGWPGNLFEAYDQGNVFFAQDPEPWGCAAAEDTTCGASYNPLLLSAGEKLVGPVLTMGGIVMFVTYYVDVSPCDVGVARIYAYSLDDNCAGAYESGQDWGPDGYGVTDSKYVEIDGIPSAFAYSNEGIYLTITDGSGNIDTIGPIRPTPNTSGQDRVFFQNWRNVF